MHRVDPIRYRAYRQSGSTAYIADSEISKERLTSAHEHLVLLRPRFIGVCSADIRELRGERPARRDFGHEVVGTVAESSHGLFRPGESVVLNPFREIDRETAFSEIMYLAGSYESMAQALVKVPSTNIEFCTVEPLSCVIHAARHSLNPHTEPKLVLGAGFFGYLLYRYLEFTGVSVKIANRTPERLVALRQKVGHIDVFDYHEPEGSPFATVFLMQARLSAPDVLFAGRLIKDYGEIVLFGGVDRAVDPTLHTTRNMQRRTSCQQDGKHYFLQGTLDASMSDVEEAVALLSNSQFAQAVSAVFAEPLTFEEGATHLTHRAVTTQPFCKFVVGMKADP